MGNPIAVLFERLLPETLAPLLGQVLGPRLLPAGDQGLHRVRASGQFSGPQTADLLNFAKSQELDGALVVAESDVERALYFEGGEVVAAESNVLFERVGRILYREEVLDHDDMEIVVHTEELSGAASCIQMLPEETGRWGLERRIWEVATALYFTRNAHFIIVEGEPNLGDLPTFCVSPMNLAMEGMRVYDEWRNTPTGSDDVPKRSPGLSEKPEKVAALVGEAPEAPVVEEKPSEDSQKLVADAFDQILAQ